MFINFQTTNDIQFFDILSTDIWGSQSRWICGNCWFIMIAFTAYSYGVANDAFLVNLSFCSIIVYKLPSYGWEMGQDENLPATVGWAADKIRWTVVALALSTSKLIPENGFTTISMFYLRITSHSTIYQKRKKRDSTGPENQKIYFILRNRQ